MAKLQLSLSLSLEVLLPMHVKQTVGVSATIAVSFQKVLDQFFFPVKLLGYLPFPICYKV